MREVIVEISSNNPVMCYPADQNFEPSIRSFGRKGSDGSFGFKSENHYYSGPKWKAGIILPESHPFFNISIFGKTSDFSVYAEVIKRRSIRPILEYLVAQFS